MNMQMKNWTYGTEHEWGDWPRERELPDGFSIDRRDCTIVNSNGIAADPKAKLYKFGGEINTPPTSSHEQQIDCLLQLREHLPEATVNYRSNLHLHIRVPGLRENLEMLKQVQKHIHQHMPKALELVEPIPEPILGIDFTFAQPEDHRGAARRYRRRKVSHHTLLKPKRLEHQLAAGALEEFWQREVPQSKVGKPLWHFQPRLCVNLRQHLETDTIEFRHFPGTLDEYELDTAFRWCKDYLHHALAGMEIDDLLERYKDNPFPKFPEYVHWMECRYRATCHDHTLSKDTIAENIRRIEAGEFDDIDEGVLT